MAERGFFLTMEGPEGSGKTTQTKDFCKWIRDQWGYEVYATREPGGTDIGNQVRNVLLNLGNTAMHFRTEVLLFQAARAQNVEQELRPRIDRGEVVVCDRYKDSTMAYQGFGHKTDLKELNSLVEYATGGLDPDLTIVMDIDPEIGIHRKKSGEEWNRIDAAAMDFHKRVREGYLELAKKDPGRIKIVDASQGIKEVQDQMRAVFNEFMTLRAPALLGIAGRFE